MSYTNFLMDLMSIPKSETDPKKEEEKELAPEDEEAEVLKLLARQGL